MRAYLDLLQRVLDDGVARTDRTGTGTRSIFGYQLRCDLATTFPLLTTKKLHTRSIIQELLWFLKLGESAMQLRARVPVARQVVLVPDVQTLADEVSM